MLSMVKNRRPGRGRTSNTETSSLLTGSTGISANKTLGTSTDKSIASHPAANVDEFTSSHVTFKDPVADRGSADGAADAPAGPAAAGGNDHSWKETAETVSKKIADVMPNSAKTEESVRHLQKVQQGQTEPAGEFAKGEGTENGLFLDEEELLSMSTFPIPPEQLIQMAKDVLRSGVHKCGKLSKDFSFSAPFVGPLSADAFAKTMETLKLDDVFPDMSPRIYHIRVDPLQPNRVWFTTRPIGTNTGYLTAKLPIPVAPTGKVVELPPQTSSLTFNEKGEVEDFTMGYVMDRRLGNTNGLGGAFGFLWAIGCPFPYPEGKPWKSSWQQTLFNTGNPLLQTAMFCLDRVMMWVLPTWLYTAHGRNVP